MLFNDGNTWHYPDVSTEQYRAERDFYEHRCVTQAAKIDTHFEGMRHKLGDLRGVLWYQFPNNWTSATYQAQHFCDVLGKLSPNEMVMLDIESGSNIGDPPRFVKEWCNVIEPQLHTLAWIYNPKALNFSRSVTGPRILKSPRYSGSANRGAAPTWQWDVHQFSDQAYFPGASEPGDGNYTDWTTEQLVEHCNGKASPTKSNRQQALLLT